MLIPAMRAITVTSTLTLLVPRVRANDVDHATAAHDLAVLADLLDRRTYFHTLTTRTAAAIAEQVRLLEKSRVVMRHHVRVQLRHEIHHHHHYDEERSATEAERHAVPGNEDLGDQTHRGDVQRPPQRQPRQHLVDVLGGLLSRADAAHEGAGLLEVLRRVARVEHQRRIE